MEGTTNGPLDVDPDTLAGWQRTIDLMAEICEVPAALIMRIANDDIEVFVSSQTDGNPYRVGDKETLVGSGLYCEHVIKARAPLHVPDAMSDEDWRSNPDIKLNMISYHGHPIVAPGGNVFGTICVLDNKPRDLENQFDRLIESFKDHIERDLSLICHVHQLERKNSELAAMLARVESLEGLLSICQYCKRVRLRDADEDDHESWVAIEVYVRERINARFTHGVCPSCMESGRWKS